jgi:hypothetical protein
VKRALEVTASAILVVLAASWPLEALTFIPGIHWYLPVLLAALAGVVLSGHALAEGRLRLPFEIALPWLSALGLCLWLLLAGGYEHAFRLVLALVAFAFPIHMRPTRQEHYRCLALMVISGTVVAAVTVVGWIRGSMPTAYDLSTGTNLHFAYELPGGVVTLLVCLTVSLGLLFLQVSWSFRVWFLGAAAVMGTVIATTVAGYAGEAGDPGAAGIFTSVAGIAVGIVLLYGFSRVVAKVVVAWEERPEPIQTVHLAVLATMALAMLLFPPLPRIGYGLAAGLACAIALPGTDRGASPKVAALAVIPLVVALLNLSHVSPASMLDGRNYELAARSDFAAGDWRQLHRRLDFIEHAAPRERRTHLWRARALLAQDRPVRAAAEFGESLKQSAGTLLPGSSAREREEFLTQLRDRKSASAEPSHEFAYAYALAADGATEEVVAYLGSLRPQGGRDNGGPATAPLADAVGFLLDLDGSRHGLDQWPAGQLMAVLEAWGAEVVAAPPWFDSERLPVVLVGQMGYQTTRVLVSMPGDRDVQEQPFSIDPRGPRALDQTRWTPVFGDARRWVIEWQIGAGGRGPARLTGRGMTWDLITYETALASYAERPAITVWRRVESGEGGE